MVLELGNVHTWMLELFWSLFEVPDPNENVVWVQQALSLQSKLALLRLEHRVWQLHAITEWMTVHK
ncbi:hypothetical protein AB6C54_07040 [Vibrio splendidus]